MKAVRKLLLITDIKLKIWQWGEEKRSKENFIPFLSLRPISKKERTKNSHCLHASFLTRLAQSRLATTFFRFTLDLLLVKSSNYSPLTAIVLSPPFLPPISSPSFLLPFLLSISSCFSLPPFSFLRKYFLLILDQLPPLMSDARTDAFHRRRHRETYFCDGRTIYNVWLNDRK